MTDWKRQFLLLLKAGRPPILVFLIHCVFSLGFSAYDRLPRLDVVMHIAGGAAIAAFFKAGIEHLNRMGVIRVEDRLVAGALIFGLVAASAVLWEFAEFFADTFFQAGAQRSIANVMKDQFMGLMGAIAYIGLIQRAIWSPQKIEVLEKQ